MRFKDWRKVRDPQTLERAFQIVIHVTLFDIRSDPLFLVSERGHLVGERERRALAHADANGWVYRTQALAKAIRDAPRKARSWKRGERGWN